MDGKKLAILAIMIIVVGVIVGVVIPSNNKPAKVNQIEKSNNVNTVDSKNNIKDNNTIGNEIGNIVENTIENTVDNKNADPTPTTASKPKTDEEKAIDIVKKDYINSNTDLSSIEFSVEDKDGKGRHIVAVRNSKTTAVLAFYHVDVANNTFIKE